MQMREILTAGVDARLLGGRPLHLDLVKLDGDGPEAAWLEEIEKLIRASVASAARHARARSMRAPP